MDSLDLFNLLQEEFVLVGTLTFDGNLIRWEFDGVDERHLVDFEDFLLETAETDKEIIRDILEINRLDCHVSEPEIEETFALFYIET